MLNTKHRYERIGKVKGKKAMNEKTAVKTVAKKEVRENAIKKYFEMLNNVDVTNTLKEKSYRRDGDENRCLQIYVGTKAERVQNAIASTRFEVWACDVKGDAIKFDVWAGVLATDMNDSLKALFDVFKPYTTKTCNSNGEKIQTLFSGIPQNKIDTFVSELAKLDVIQTEQATESKTDSKTASDSKSDSKSESKTESKRQSKSKSKSDSKSKTERQIKRQSKSKTETA